MQNSDTKLLIQIKELTHSENIELKNKLKEKEELLQKYEKNYKEISEQIKEIEQKSNNFSIEELMRKENIIKEYQSRLEEKESKYTEEINLVTSVLYDVAFNLYVKDKLV